MKLGLYFFSSFFFRKLMLILKEDVKNGFKKITRWFKGINIFKCDYIFLPILLSGHWSMIVMCSLGNEPGLLHLNSLKSTTHLEAEEHIKCFLSLEWERQNNLESLKISKKDLLELQMQVVEVPQQPKDNGTDCGIYLIKIVDVFLHTVTEGVAL
ncbi:hypothetical protein KC19_VG056100 [Ceratodon purpureus]|uniref:Ubiquitin-like protease family profile domain-containing protein n=1 Tax=Ceratodon purpureus TaxID=3225 RepID=A0A8T0HMD8_CERPU|nr:hypothetical protein KC19_VG056100 [Ceratodon purpureus]